MIERTKDIIAHPRISREPKDNPSERFDLSLNALVSKEAGVRSWNSSELYNIYISILSLISAGYRVPLSLLCEYQQNYDQGLLNSRPEDPVTLASVLSYVGERLPIKIFSPNLHIHLSNDYKSIMSTPHVLTIDNTTKSYRKKTFARARWFVVEHAENGDVHLSYELRDVSPNGLSDAMEFLSWLGSLEQVRQFARKNRDKGVDISPIENAFKKIYKKQLTAEIFMLEKKLFSENISMTQRVWLIERKLLLTRRLKNFDELSRDIFEKWLDRDGNSVYIEKSYFRQYQFPGINADDRAEFHPSLETARLIQRELKILDQIPSAIIFGNDFSIRNLLAIGLFSQEEFSFIASRFPNSEDEIKPQLSSFTSEELRDAAIKFHLIQKLSQYSGDDDEVLFFRNRIFFPDSFRRIGLTRLIPTHQSPIADPIDLLTPQNIDSDVWQNLPHVIRDIFLKMSRMTGSIISVPYTYGYLTESLAFELTKAFPSINSVGFIGKVGSVSNGSDNISVGDIVFPEIVARQFSDDMFPVVNFIDKNSPLLAEFSRFPVHRSFNLSTLALTFQNFEEMRTALLERVDKDQIVTLDVELYSLMRWYHSLSVKKKEKIKPFLIYYISDKTVFPENYNENVEKDKISNSLGARGSVGLFLCLLSMLDAISS